MRLNDEQILALFERENLVVAPLHKRFWAFVVDECLMGVLMYVLLFDKIPRGEANLNIIEITRALESFILYIIILNIAYHTIFVARYGATLGKILFKIQVISLDLLDNPSIAKSFLRAMLRYISQMLYFIPILFLFGDTFKRTLYDRACNTIVISQKK